jgi:hypothetical protein
MDRYVKSSRITMQSSYLYSPILSYSQELKELFLLPRESCVRVHHYYTIDHASRITGNGMEILVSRAAESGIPCEKKPRLLPSSRSFAAEERTPAGASHLYYTRKRLISANAMEMEILPRRSCRAQGKGILNTWLPASTLFNGDGEQLLTSCQAGCVVPLYY